MIATQNTVDIPHLCSSSFNIRPKRESSKLEKSTIISRSFNINSIGGIVNSERIFESEPMLLVRSETVKLNRVEKKSLPLVIPEKLVACLKKGKEATPNLIDKYAKREYKKVQNSYANVKRWGDKCKEYPTACAFQNYVKKNRYPDVLPPEHSRVKLDDTQNDYINANYIQNLNKHAAERYISTQAPTAETFADFWLMIWQQRIAVVVMLTKLEENGIKKADLYFPAQKDDLAIYGDFQVQNKSVKNLNGIIVSSLAISHNGETRSINHIVYELWPDKDVPKDSQSILQLSSLIDIYREQNKQVLDGPVLCHCSAGIGRTATLIAIHQSLQLIKKGYKPKVSNIVNRIREQRHGSVQTSDQYSFIFKTVNHYINEFNKRETFSSHMELSYSSKEDRKDCKKSILRKFYTLRCIKNQY
jgi:protein tyrosine phosphatase